MELKGNVMGVGGRPPTEAAVRKWCLSSGLWETDKPTVPWVMFRAPEKLCM